MTYLAPYAYHEPGEMPGTLVKVPNIFLIEYNTDRAQGIHLPTPEDAVPYLLNATTTSWFDLTYPPA
jgi:hypothetical protein